MLSGRQILETFDAWKPASPLARTGLTGLDELTGGLLAGHVWVITGDVGEGKTALLSQLAVVLGTAGAAVQLVCPREPSAATAKRLLACLGRININHSGASHPQQSRYDEARETTASLPMLVFAKDTVPFTPEEHPYLTPSAAAVLVDDADLVGGMTPQRIAQYAAANRFVAVTLPRDQVLHARGDRAPLRPEWTRVADVVLEVRSRTIGDVGMAGTSGHRPADLRPGEAELVLHRHRWGPAYTIMVQERLWQGRFADLPEPDPQ